MAEIFSLSLFRRSGMCWICLESDLLALPGPKGLVLPYQALVVIRCLRTCSSDTYARCLPYFVCIPSDVCVFAIFERVPLGTGRILYHIIGPFCPGGGLLAEFTRRQRTCCRTAVFSGSKGIHSSRYVERGTPGGVARPQQYSCRPALGLRQDCHFVGGGL